MIWRRGERLLFMGKQHGFLTFGAVVSRASDVVATFLTRTAVTVAQYVRGMANGLREYRLRRLHRLHRLRRENVVAMSLGTAAVVLAVTVLFVPSDGRQIGQEVLASPEPRFGEVHPYLPTDPADAPQWIPVPGT